MGDFYKPRPCKFCGRSLVQGKEYDLERCFNTVLCRMRAAKKQTKKEDNDGNGSN